MPFSWLGGSLVFASKKGTGELDDAEGSFISIWNSDDDDGCDSIKLAETRRNDALDSISLTGRRLAAMAISGVSSTTGPATFGDCASGGSEGGGMYLGRYLDDMQTLVLW